MSQHILLTAQSCMFALENEDLEHELGLRS